KLISRNSAFDKFVHAANPSSDLLTPAARRGAQLFVSRAGCIECHNTPLLSDNQFHNVGVAQSGPFVPTEADCPDGGSCDCVYSDSSPEVKNCLPWGAFDGLGKLKSNKFRRDSVWSDDPGDVSRAPWYEL